MGYYTYFTVSWDRHSDGLIDIAIEEKFNDLTGINCDSWDTANKHVLGFLAKWYYWEDDINKLSRMYPDIVFEVSGDGDNSEDLWSSIWKDGCYEYQEAIIPPFTGQMKEYKEAN